MLGSITRVALIAVILACAGDAAVLAKDYYENKRINLYIGYGAGGGYDFYARLAARHIVNHIPGAPTVTPQNMVGAGGLKVINYMANIAPKDGTALAMGSESLVIERALQPAESGLDYDATKLAWVGRMSPTTNVFFAWHTSKTKTLEDLRRYETAFASSGSGVTFYMPRALNLWAGTKFKLITGYSGSSETTLAMERGEVDATFSLLSDLTSRRADWLRDKKINMLVIIAGKRAADAPDVPIASELGTTAEGREILKFLSSGTADIGKALFAAAGTPAEPLKVLRTAFMAMMDDAEFRKEAQRANLEIDALPGEELQKLVIAADHASKTLAEKARAVVRN
jgi:tripartite-type tricarboxylate transporter receptor subunit TctC